jgi:putative MATE family efflux protein
MYSMVGMATGCVINLILDPIFINTLGLGVAGAAIATDISKFVSLLILLWPFLRRKCVVQLKPSFFTPTREIYGEIARMGIPTMLRTSMMSISTILINNIAASFSDAAMASIAVANKSLRLVASGIMGFSQGFQPVAGYSFGAKRYGRVLRAFRYTLTIGAICGTALGAVLYVFAPQVIGTFSGDPGVMRLGLILIRTQSAVLVPHVWTMICSGFFQSMGKAMKAGVLGMSRQLLVLIPSILILSHFFGAMGLACAQATTDVVAFILAACLTAPTIKELMALRRSETDTGDVADATDAPHTSEASGVTDIHDVPKTADAIGMLDASESLDATDVPDTPASEVKVRE